MRSHHAVIAAFICLFGLTIAIAQQPGRTPNPTATQPTTQSEQTSQQTIPQAQRPPERLSRTQLPREPQPESEQPESAERAQARRGPPPEEKSSVTHHSGRIGGQPMNYTAAAATYVIRADDGTPKATMFFVAYTRDNVPDIAKRAVSFVYNGGPGAASLFTHMGMGPKRVVLTADGRGMPAPYTTVDNEDSFLDATDLVFIDAISTGYSRPAPGERPSQFHGIIADANWFADFIYQYITRNQRWASPKYLIGESYGTTRSAELAGVLQERHQIYLNGIVLLSAVAFANWGGDDRFEFFLPTYTTTAWYHHLLAADLQNESIEQVAQQARDFAHGGYAAALQKGDQLSPQEYQKIVQDIARFTALSPRYIEQTSLRVSPFRWFKEAPYDPEREPRAAEVVRLAEDFGVLDGFVIPVASPAGRMGQIWFGGRTLDLEEDQLPALHLMAIYAFDRSLALHARREPLPLHRASEAP